MDVESQEWNRPDDGCEESFAYFDADWVYCGIDVIVHDSAYELAVVWLS